MRLEWKLLLAPASPPALLHPILSSGVLLAVGWVVKSINPAFAKRFTTVTGFG
jgi:hypothetical protein